MINSIFNNTIINTPNLIGPVSNAAVTTLPSLKGLTSAQIQQFNQLTTTTSPIFWKVAWVALLLACNEESSPEENQIIDRDQDGDGIPDQIDQCDREFARTANGCPPGVDPDDPCRTDSDGDGFVDCEDQCPYESHPGRGPEANGCAPDDEDFIELDGGIRNPPDSSMPLPWRILPERTIDIVGNSHIICPQLDRNGEHLGLAWQSGGAVYSILLDQNRLDQIDLPDGSIALTNSPLCRFTKALAVSSNGTQAVLTTFARDENTWSLKLSIKYPGEDDEQLILVTEAFEFNDDNNRNRIASIEALPHNGFVVTWIDRDRVRAQIYDENGNENGASFQVNQVRQPNNPVQVKSPDVILVNNQKIIFTWQEGNDPQGNPYRAEFDLGGNRIDDDFLLINHPDQIGFGPQVRSGNSLEFYDWIDTQNKGFGFLDMHEGMNFYIGFGDGRVLSTQASLDNQDRLAVFWTEEAQIDRAQLKFAGVGLVSDGPTDEEYPGFLLGEVHPDAGMAAVSSGELVYLAIPQVRDPNKLQLRILRWEQE